MISYNSLDWSLSIVVSGSPKFGGNYVANRPSPKLAVKIIPLRTTTYSPCRTWGVKNAT